MGYYQGHHLRFGVMKFRLGDICNFSFAGSKKKQLCKFIKVTRKGFNFLNIETSKCILRSHLYAKDMAGKEFPKDIGEVSVWLADIFYVEKVKQAKVG